MVLAALFKCIQGGAGWRPRTSELLLERSHCDHVIGMSKRGWSRFEALMEDHIACNLTTIQACFRLNDGFLPPRRIIVSVVGLRSSPRVWFGLTDGSQEIKIDIDGVVRHGGGYLSL